MICNSLQVYATYVLEVWISENYNVRGMDMQYTGRVQFNFVQQ